MKTKKILIGIIAVITVLCAIAFTGCSAECEHQWTDATCTAPKTCSLCSETEGEPLGHSYKTEYDKNESKHWYQCSVCNVKKDEADHTWNVPAATELTDKFCTVCSYVAEYQIGHTHTFDSTLSHDDEGHYYAATCGHVQEKKDYEYHTFATATVEPTCTEKGYTTYTCGCGKVVKDNYVDAHGHEFCTTLTKDGAGHWYAASCSHIGERKDYAAHNYTWVVTPATCTDQGYTTYTCECGDSFVAEYVDAKGHSVAKWDEVSCTPVSGTNSCMHEVVYSGLCSGCNTTQIKTEYIEIHAFTLKTIVAPTCISDGVQHKLCKNSGCKYTETPYEILTPEDPNAHNWVEASGQTYTHECNNDGCDATKTTVTGGASASVSNETIKKVDEVKLDTATIGLDAGIQNKLSALTGEVSIAAGTLNDTERNNAIENLSEEEIALLGNNTIYNFTVNNGTVTQLGGDATIRIPYKLNGADPDNIIVWYVNDGNITPVKATYIEENGEGYVTFTTNHFSHFSATTVTPEELCNQLGHDKANTHTVHPTCTEIGYTLCLRCGKQVEDSVKAPLGHSWQTTVISVSSCSVNGVTEYKCSACEISYETVVAATGHYFALINQVNASCTESGSLTYDCIYCTEGYSVTVPQLSHNYEDFVKIVAPTCEERGYTEKTCTSCAETIYVNFISATGHTPDSDWHKDPSGHYHICTSCGKKLDDTAHNPGADATEISDQICTVCEYVIVPKKTHVHSLTKTEAVKADCVTVGNIEYYTCECGKWFADAAATQLITDRVSVIVDAKGHTYESIPHVDPTCTTKGHTAGIKCSVCNVVIKGNVEIPAYSHNYVTEETAPSCTTNGKITEICSYCQDAKPEQTLEALGHKYIGSITAPTCTENGYTTFNCARCGDNYVGDEKTAPGHSVSATWISDANGHWRECSVCKYKENEATHTPDRENADTDYAKICTVCEYIIEERINHEHNGVLVPQKAPTCTIGGNIAYYVCECDKWFYDAECTQNITDKTSVNVKPLNHKIGFVEATEPTCTENGYTEGFYCNRCEQYLSGHEEISSEGHAYATEWSSDENEHWHECSKCGDKADKAGHSFNVTEATEETAKFCTECNYLAEEQLAHTHKFDNWTAPVPATCTENGAIGYFTCTCGKLFDEEHNEVTDITVQSEGHEYATEWSSDENEHWHECSKCGNKADKAGHSFNVTEATEETAKFCTECSYLAEEKLAHTHKFNNWTAPVPATCTENGTVGYFTCTCGKFFDEEQNEITDLTVQSDGHEHATEWSSDENEHWHECSKCGDKADKAGHSFNVTEATEETAKFCTECNYLAEEQLAHTHKFDNWTAPVPATCTENGTVGYFTCTCGKFFDEEQNEITDLAVQSDGHAYATEWSSDENDHWHECSKCGDKADKTEHVFNGSDCECGKEYIAPAPTVKYEYNIVNEYVNINVLIYDNGTFIASGTEIDAGGSVNNVTYEGTWIEDTDGTIAAYLDGKLVKRFAFTESGELYEYVCEQHQYVNGSCEYCGAEYVAPEVETLYVYELNSQSGSLTLSFLSDYTLTVKGWQDSVEVNDSGTWSLVGENVIEITVYGEKQRFVIGEDGTLSPEKTECAHKNQTTETVDPSCEQNGYEYITCVDCEKLIDITVIPALGHNYNKVTGICGNCGESIPAPDVTVSYSYELNNDIAQVTYAFMSDFTINVTGTIEYDGVPTPVNEKGSWSITADGRILAIVYDEPMLFEIGENNEITPLDGTAYVSYEYIRNDSEAYIKFFFMSDKSIIAFGQLMSTTGWKDVSFTGNWSINKQSGYLEACIDGFTQLFAINEDGSLTIVENGDDNNEPENEIKYTYVRDDGSTYIVYSFMSDYTIKGEGYIYGEGGETPITLTGSWLLNYETGYIEATVNGDTRFFVINEDGSLTMIEGSGDNGDPDVQIEYTYSFSDNTLTVTLEFFSDFTFTAKGFEIIAGNKEAIDEVGPWHINEDGLIEVILYGYPQYFRINEDGSLTPDEDYEPGEDNKPSVLHVYYLENPYASVTFSFLSNNTLLIKGWQYVSETETEEIDDEGTWYYEDGKIAGYFYGEITYFIINEDGSLSMDINQGGGEGGNTPEQGPSTSICGDGYDILISIRYDFTFSANGYYTDELGEIIDVNESGFWDFSFDGIIKIELLGETLYFTVDENENLIFDQSLGQISEILYTFWHNEDNYEVVINFMDNNILKVEGGRYDESIGDWIWDIDISGTWSYNDNGDIVAVINETSTVFEVYEGILVLKCDHIHTQTYTYFMETCLLSGCHYVICDDCERNISDIYTDPLGHSYDEDGICERCGANETDPEPAEKYSFEYYEVDGEYTMHYVMSFLDNYTYTLNMIEGQVEPGVEKDYFVGSWEITYDNLIICYIHGNEIMVLEFDENGDLIEYVCKHTETFDETQEPSCFFDGAIVTYCSECYEEISREIIPSPGHSFDENKVCTKCGYSEGNSGFDPVYPPEEECKHEYYYDKGIPATCLLTGFEYLRCEKCDAFISYKYLDPDGHSFDEYGKCTVCGASDKEPEPTTVYTYQAPEEIGGMLLTFLSNNTVKVTGVQMTENGPLEMYLVGSWCVNDKEVIEVYVLGDLSFLFTDEDGVLTEYECTHEDTERVENTTPPWCEMEGTVYVYCGYCGDFIEEYSVPALEHNYVDGRCETCGKYENDGPIFVKITKYVYIDETIKLTLYTDYSVICTPSLSDGMIGTIIIGTWSEDYDTGLITVYVNGMTFIFRVENGKDLVLEEKSEGGSDCTHQAVFEKTQMPTCETPGCKTKICMSCGIVLNNEEIPALGHDYDENGVCYVCGRVGYPEDLCKHEQIVDLVFKYPTCATSGYTFLVCDNCEEVFDGYYTEPLGHVYDEDGFCECGRNLTDDQPYEIYTYTYKDEYEDLHFSFLSDFTFRFNGEEFSDDENAFFASFVAPWEYFSDNQILAYDIFGNEFMLFSIKEDGSIEVYVCPHEGDTVTNTEPAGCDYDGAIITYCFECGEELYREPIYAYGHSYDDSGYCVNCGNYISSTDPEVQIMYNYCSNDGMLQISFLSDNTLKIKGKVINDDGSVSRYPTEGSWYNTADGYIIAEFGEFSMKFVIDTDGNAALVPDTECTHENTYPEEKNATCTEWGYYRVICSDCGETIYNRNYDILTHTFENGVCTVCGSEEVTPENCNHAKTYPEEKAATCTESGYYRKVCADCGIVTHNEDYAPLTHNIVDGKCQNCDTIIKDDFIIGGLVA